jgi:regulatory protein YycH of two-component signal transduction system YycFG
LRERLKSVFLFLLVLSSLYMTYRLWFGPRHLEEVAEYRLEPVQLEEPRPLSEIVAPRWICFQQGDTLYHFGPGSAPYEQLWNGVAALLSELTYPNSQDEFLPLEESHFRMTLSFRPLLPIGEGMPWLPGAPPAQLSEIEFRAGETEAAAILKEAAGALEAALSLDQWQGQELARLAAELPLDDVTPCHRLDQEELRELTGLQFSLADEFIVPEPGLSLSVLTVRPEELDMETLLDTFFFDRRLVREIRERDGALIYTDGEKGLRIREGLDFSFPLREQERATADYATALNTAGRLLSWHGGWPEALRLENLSLIREANRQHMVYYACWDSYYDGFPFTDHAATLYFNDGGLVKYRREYYKTLGEASPPAPVNSYQEALLAALNLYQEQEAGIKEPLALEEFALAYAVVTGEADQLYAFPVWVIRLDGNEYVFKAAGLTLLEEVHS